MTITDVRSFTLTDNDRSTELLVVRTDTDEIGVGEIGEGGPGQETRPIDAGFAERIIGRSPYDLEAALADLLDPDGPAIDIELVSAAQAAMADIVGRGLGVPVHQLMGGRVRDHVRACAVNWMGESPLDLMHVREAAARAVASGFTALRVDPAGPDSGGPIDDPAEALEIVRVVRDSVPDHVDLVVALGGRFTAQAAAAFLAGVQSFEPLWVEDPAIAGLSVLPEDRAQLTTPLAAGRRVGPGVLLELVTRNLVDRLILDPRCVAGPLEARRIAAIAEISHIDVVLVGAGGPVGLGTALNLAAAIPNVSMVEVRPGAIDVIDGVVEVDLRPGLGPEPSELGSREAGW